MTKPKDIPASGRGDELPSYIIEEMNKNWHRAAREFWGIFPGAPKFCTDEQAADELRSHYEQSGKVTRATWPIKRHVLNALVLDLICASFPEGHPPPESLLKVMKAALDLPADHDISSWVLNDGRDGRGGVNKRAWYEAINLDRAYYEEHQKEMPLRELEREVASRTGGGAYRSTLRKWRQLPRYREEAELPPL